MIDLRTHLASLVAVFIALGIGILVGVDMIGGKGIIVQEQAMVQKLETDFSNLRAQNTTLSATIKQQQATIAADRRFAQEMVPYVVAGRLSGQVVAVVATEPGFDPLTVSRVLREAGAKVWPVITCQTPTSATLSAASGVLGTASQAPAVYSALADALSATFLDGDPANLPQLQQAGLFHLTGSLKTQVTAVLLVAGNASAPDALAAQFGLPLVHDLQGTGMPVTEAEASTVPAADSTIPTFDGVGIATVDDVDLPPGEISMVWGLSGAVGTWGQKQTAQALMPALKPLSAAPPPTATPGKGPS